VNGYCEFFNGKLPDELLNGEIFLSLKEAQILIEQWRKHYNTIRSHSALNFRLPAPKPRLTTWMRSCRCSNLYRIGTKNQSDYYWAIFARR
jgi:hypothetical protein